MTSTSRRVAPFGLVTSVDQGNGIADPLNTRATPNGTGWFEWAGGTGTAPAYAMVSDSSGVLPAGRWAEMDFTGTSGGTRRLSTPAVAVTAGDVLVHAATIQIEDVSGTWQTDVAAGTCSVTAQLVDSGSGLVLTASSMLQRNPGIRVGTTGVYNYGPIAFASTVGAGTANVVAWYSLTVPTGARIKMRVGCTGIINTTTIGTSAYWSRASVMVNA